MKNNKNPAWTIWSRINFLLVPTKNRPDNARGQGQQAVRARTTKVKTNVFEYVLSWLRFNF